MTDEFKRMNMLPVPKDPQILFSYINMWLRDEYASLDDLCKDMGLEKNEIERKLNAIGYFYTPEFNKFW